MAVTKSDVVTNADDLDTQNESNQNSRLISVAAHEAASALSDNDVILMMEIPVDARIPSLKFAADDLGTTGTLNVGFYPGPGSGVTISADTDAVDEDALATAIDVNTAATAQTEIRYEVKAIETINQKAWELAGLSSRPDYGTFYIALTAAAATTAAGDVTLELTYTV